MRGYGIYAYKIADPKVFHQKISGTRDIYRVGDLEGQLRNTIVARMTDSFAQSTVPFLDMAANQELLGQKIAENLKPAYADFGLSLESFVVENISLPDELQKMLDQRISMNMIGDMSKYTQFQVAQSMPIAALGAAVVRRLHRRGLAARLSLALRRRSRGGPSSASIAGMRFRKLRSFVPNAEARRGRLDTILLRSTQAGMPVLHK